MRSGAGMGLQAAPPGPPGWPGARSERIHILFPRRQAPRRRARSTLSTVPGHPVRGSRDARPRGSTTASGPPDGECLGKDGGQPARGSGTRFGGQSGGCEYTDARSFRTGRGARGPAAGQHLGELSRRLCGLLPECATAGRRGSRDLDFSSCSHHGTCRNRHRRAQRASVSAVALDLDAPGIARDEAVEPDEPRMRPARTRGPRAGNIDITLTVDGSASAREGGLITRALMRLVSERQAFGHQRCAFSLWALGRKREPIASADPSGRVVPDPRTGGGTLSVVADREE